MHHKLNQEEKELLDSYENDAWSSIKKSESSAKYSAIASNTFKKIKESIFVFLKLT